MPQAQARVLLRTLTPRLHKSLEITIDDFTDGRRGALLMISLMDAMDGGQQTRNNGTAGCIFKAW
jgi:hypothetical protein